MDIPVDIACGTRAEPVHKRMRNRGIREGITRQYRDDWPEPAAQVPAGVNAST